MNEFYTNMMSGIKEKKKKEIPYAKRTFKYKL